MKKILFLLLASAFLFPMMESQAQTKAQPQAQQQELTKQQIRQMKRDQRKKARQMADERIEGQKSTIQDAGLEIITLEPAMIQEMADVSANVYDLVREQIGTDLVDSLLAQVETASAAE